MRVVLFGSGGREHALAWRLTTSDSVDDVLVIPGNAGIAREPGCRVLASDDPAATPQALADAGIDLAIVGPEEPLVQGLADRLRDVGIATVGPGADLAQLEGSKAFAKRIMDAAGIRTAEYRVCASEAEAFAAIDAFGAPLVVKADGLAAGKGVAVCESHEQARAAVQTIMRDRLFGAAGDTVIVERHLDGFEASVIVLVDESGYLVLPTARDHKRIGEGDTGPNTGGMGAVAPNADIDAALAARIDREVVAPSVAAIQERGGLFRGFLFIGLMVGDDGPSVLEYNVRFGDPEAQAILPLVAGDFGVLMHGLATGKLATAVGASGYAVRAGASCAVVAASQGYPTATVTGREIVLHEPPASSALAGGLLFFAGVGAGAESELVTAGGRVLAVVATAGTLVEARRAAYRRLALVAFDGMQVRRDVGGPILGGELREEADALLADFGKRGGLLPVVVQDADDGSILMVASVDPLALAETRASGVATFWSTSRSSVWRKGETSGERMRVVEILVDCDQDAFVYRVRRDDGRTGPVRACHTHTDDGAFRRTCFYRRVEADGRLTFLE